MNVKGSRNALLGNTLVKALSARHFDACYCPTRADACAKALEMIAPGSSVAWGGGMSLIECGLIDALRAGDYVLFDREKVLPEDRQALYAKMLTADTFLMSANAISQTGELVNIDGTGNRVAALCFGPKQVIVIAGLNKAAPTLRDAVIRARSTAAPLNAQRFLLQTPCRATGVCGDCKGADSICAQIVLTRLCRPAGRIKVILCGEDLGF
ncbi:MAG: lactate utilization protein [Clostridia bacterium]|nr:lactate utilization protein [Clostridia bacterium]